MRSARRCRLVIAAALLVGVGATFGAPRHAAADFKIAHWNIASGFGKAGWQGTCPFSPGSDCTANAWGNGAGPCAQTLTSVVGNDSMVAALVMNEAWTCTTPSRVAALLGSPWAIARWPNTATDRDGVTVLTRYGLAGPTESVDLPLCTTTSEQRHVLRAPVYVDAARTQVVQLYATHWNGCAAEADATVDFMSRAGSAPKLLVGDLNAKDPTTYPITRLTGSGYTDVWPHLYGTAVGHTSTWNSQYGTPTGNLYKRIDYVMTRGITPVALARFNHDAAPGYCVRADHAGLVFRGTLASTTPAPSPTPTPTPGPTPTPTPSPTPTPAPSPTPTPTPSPTSLSVQLVGLTSGQSVSGGVAVEATVTGSGVTRVDFTIDGALTKRDYQARYCLGGETGSGRCHKWDSRTSSNGSHTIKATAYNNAGQTASAAVTVTVRNP